VFVQPILLALGQPERLSEDVEKFLRVLILGAHWVRESEEILAMSTYVYVSAYSRRTQLTVAQLSDIMGAATAVLMIVFPINIILNVGLIHYTSLGLLGSPAALSITYWMCFLLLGLYTYFSPEHTRNSTWGGIQPRVVFDLKSCLLFLQLALPGILMVGTEWSV
jgi:MATE family multidrug resistance protein